MEYHGTTSPGVSKPQIPEGEKPLYARNGNKPISSFPRSLSLRRINVVRDHLGNGYYTRSSWDFGSLSLH